MTTGHFINDRTLVLSQICNVVRNLSDEGAATAVHPLDCIRPPADLTALVIDAGRNPERLQEIGTRKTQATGMLRSLFD